MEATMDVVMPGTSRVDQQPTTDQEAKKPRLRIPLISTIKGLPDTIRTFSVGNLAEFIIDAGFPNTVEKKITYVKPPPSTKELAKMQAVKAEIERLKRAHERRARQNRRIQATTP